MGKQNWIELLDWNEEQISDLRHAAYTYIKQGIYDVALIFFDAISVLTPPIAYDLQTVGALCLQKGDGLKALDYFDRALKMDPDHFLTKLNRAKALFLLGYKKQGLLQASELINCPDEEIASQARALFLAYE